MSPPANRLHTSLVAPPAQAICGSTLPICSLSLQPNNHLGSGFGSRVPHFHKLDLPTYDGSVDPLSWLHRCEQFFRSQCTAEADKVWTATYHLTNDTQFLYLQLERDFGMPTWEQLKEACMFGLGRHSARNPLSELAHLPFTSSIVD